MQIPERYSKHKKSCQAKTGVIDKAPVFLCEFIILKYELLFSIFELKWGEDRFSDYILRSICRVLYGNTYTFR